MSDLTPHEYDKKSIYTTHITGTATETRPDRMKKEEEYRIRITKWIRNILTRYSYLLVEAACKNLNILSMA